MFWNKNKLKKSEILILREMIKSFKLENNIESDNKIENCNNDDISPSEIIVIKELIKRYAVNNVCPSVLKLFTLSKFEKEKIYKIKNVLKKENFIHTVGTRTYITKL